MIGGLLVGRRRPAVLATPGFRPLPIPRIWRVAAAAASHAPPSGAPASRSRCAQKAQQPWHAPHWLHDPHRRLVCALARRRRARAPGLAVGQDVAGDRGDQGGRGSRPAAAAFGDPPRGGPRRGRRRHRRAGPRRRRCPVGGDRLLGTAGGGRGGGRHPPRRPATPRPTWSIGCSARTRSARSVLLLARRALPRPPATARARIESSMRDQARVAFEPAARRTACVAVRPARGRPGASVGAALGRLDRRRSDVDDPSATAVGARGDAR